MKKIFVALFFGFTIIEMGQSQSLTEDTVMFDLSTPYRAINSFNFYSQSTHFNPTLIKKCAELASNDSSNFPKKLIQLIKGEGIYAIVTLMKDAQTPSSDNALIRELEELVRTEIGPIAKPDNIQWAPGLPKTRSGKIMQRILRKIAAKDFENLGDTSTLADPSVVADLTKGR